MALPFFGPKPDLLFFFLFFFSLTRGKNLIFVPIMKFHAWRTMLSCFDIRECFDGNGYIVRQSVAALHFDTPALRVHFTIAATYLLEFHIH